MSAEAMGYVYRHSPFRGATFDVHLAMADSVNDQHHNEFWLKKARLAEKARVSLASTKTALAVLAAEGYVELLEESGGRWPSRYRFLFPDAPVVYESRHIPTGQSLAGSFRPTRRGGAGRTGQTLAGSTGQTLAGCPDVQPANRQDQPANLPSPTGQNENDFAPHKEITQEIPRDPNISSGGHPDAPPSLALVPARSAGVDLQDDVERLCTLLADLVAANGSKRPIVTVRWRQECERLLRLDGHTAGQVENAIRWSQADSFWCTNVLSMPTLRHQYDKLRLAAIRERGGPPGVVDAASSYLERRRLQ